MSPEQVPRVIVRTRIDRVGGKSIIIDNAPSGRSPNDLSVVSAAYVEKFGDPIAKIRLRGELVRELDLRGKRPLTVKEIAYKLDRLLMKKERNHVRARSNA